MLEQNINLVRKVAWRWAKRTGMEFDELFSEACLIYLEADLTYIPKEGAVKKSTYMWHMMNHRLCSLCTKETKKTMQEGSDFDELYDFYDTNMPTPEEHLLQNEEWEEFVSSLSAEGQAICELLLENDTYINLDSPKNARGIIRDLMQEQGWPLRKIWNGFREIKAELAMV